MKNNTNVNRKNSMSGRVINAGLRTAYWLVSKKQGSPETSSYERLSDQEVISKYAEIEKDRVVMFRKNKKHSEKSEEGRCI